ncbi:hypothetical protein [Brucella intermedia]|uniref:hypothetical protein n=1 Tax=Brucella intermedia TaxID=94625 RepID=UPI00187AF735|nr:hypothetical protein [Brucella intermedia]
MAIIVPLPMTVPNLEEINWNDFFAIFDDRKLAFLYEETEDSRFNKFIDAEQNS